MNIQLKESLAQRIVEGANKITNYPISVMDKDGYIIASTNPARLYQKHGGAILAISEQKPIEISSHMLAEFPNVTPGINLPILFNKEPIGVIGIAGPLEDVRPLGEMVKMAAELVVEYMSMMDATRWNERQGEEFLLECIDSETPPNHILNRASMLKLTLDEPFALVIVESQIGDDIQDNIDILKSWSSKHIMAEYTNNMSIILMTMSNSDRFSNDIMADWQGLKNYFEESFPSNIICALGSIYHNIIDLPKAFESALAVLKSGKRLKPDNHFYQYSDFELPALFDGVFNEWQFSKIHHYVELLELTDPSLIDVLICWYEHDCDIKKTSSKLFIHPNTLRYRIKRAEEICHLNLSDYKDKCRLYFSLIL
ncbi:CdaR family transcriptional regulator [Vibrio sp. RC27]